MAFTRDLVSRRRQTTRTTRRKTEEKEDESRRRRRYTDPLTDQMKILSSKANELVRLLATLNYYPTFVESAKSRSTSYEIINHDDIPPNP